MKKKIFIVFGILRGGGFVPTKTFFLYFFYWKDNKFTFSDVDKKYLGKRRMGIRGIVTQNKPTVEIAIKLRSNFIAIFYFLQKAMKNVLGNKKNSPICSGNAIGSFYGDKIPDRVPRRLLCCSRSCTRCPLFPRDRTC